jgi:energy-coupling factor transporter ATP-binding protein EcfA2
VIETVAITGYKCLRDVKTTLSPFTVLIGPNDSGKSTFLQVLASVRLLPTTLGARWTLGFRRANGLRGSVELYGTLPWLRIREEQSPDVTVPVQNGVVELRRFPFLFASEPVSIDAALIARPSPKGSGRVDDGFIALRGLGVAAHLARLALGDRQRYETIQAELVRITDGRVKEFMVGEDTGEGYPLSFKLYDGSVIPAHQLSQGLLVFLFFLALIHRDDAPRVLLIEEPENGLHPLRLHEVVNLLRSLTQQGVQVILTTHSPDLLSACDPTEVRVFLRPQADSGTEIHELPKGFDGVAMRDTLGQIWASRGEEGLLDRLPTVKPRIQRK